MVIIYFTRRVYTSPQQSKALHRRVHTSNAVDRLTCPATTSRSSSNIEEMTHKICSNLRLSATLCFVIVAAANTSHLLMEIAYPLCKSSAKFHFTFRFPPSVSRVTFSLSNGSVRSLAWQPNRFVIDATNEQPRFVFPPLFLLVAVESWRQYLRREFLLRVDHERLPRQFDGKRGSIAGNVEVLSGFVGRIYATIFVIA